MDKTKIPPIKIDSTFYPITKEKTIDWLRDLQLYSEADLNELKLKQKGDIVEIIQKLYDSEETRAFIHDKIVTNFPKYCGIGPSKVEEILTCTTTERKRWEAEKKIPVVDTFNGGTRKRPMWIPMYCRRTIESLNDDILSRWRADHEAAVSLSRKAHEKIVFSSKNVIINGYKENDRIYTIMGPVLIPEDTIDEFWDKHKVKVPYEWDNQKCVIILQEYNTQQVLKINVVDGNS